MKRQLKFRGKRLDNGEWVYGSLGMSATKAPYILWSDGDIVVDDPIVSQESIGQFTGLKAEDDEELYEGDIVEICRFDHNGTDHHYRAYVDFYRGGVYSMRHSPSILSDDKQRTT